MELKTAHDGIDCNVPVRLQYSRMHILKFRHRTSKMLFWYDSVVCNICMIVCMCITRGRVHWTWGLLYWSITIIRTCLFCTIGLVETVYNLDLVTSTWMFSSECSVLIACICVPQADRELLQYTRKTRKPKHSIQDLCPIQKTADKVRCTLSLTWIK